MKNQVWWARIVLCVIALIWIVTIIIISQYSDDAYSHLFYEDVRNINAPYDIKFIGRPRLGSVYLRGTMISKELEKLYPHMKLKAPLEDSWFSKRFRSHLCIFVKPELNMFHIPRENCNYIAIDVLDMNIHNASQLLHDYESHIFITSSKALEKQLISLGQKAVTIYHQQTNIYNQRIHGDNHRSVKTMAFMTGVSANIPSERILERIGNHACSVGVQFFTILYESSERNETNIKGYGSCADVNSPDIYSPYKIIQSPNPVEYPEQLYYQDIPFKVGIGLLLPPVSNQTLIHKLAT